MTNLEASQLACVEVGVVLAEHVHAANGVSQGVLRDVLDLLGLGTASATTHPHKHPHTHTHTQPRLRASNEWPAQTTGAATRCTYALAWRRASLAKLGAAKCVRRTVMSRCGPMSSKTTRGTLVPDFLNFTVYVRSDMRPSIMVTFIKWSMPARHTSLAGRPRKISERGTHRQE